ncbi:endonuclease/exonuclease/phosphatase family metal-dependent hydrolase [Sphingobacterium allocomposti]|uniref:Endonuclease/exonuclease/phosphatase family metal-dependent hydrolase n=1 Tax=Sphingobacterium allocomposti TaxID=415956 RepID=A0A5S5DLA0_9SPHI|nr:endonuclease/exonuclease/phosphatase family protein [Sphingobacterium composti Yoo et al. 2007 non Ten et al. 2007]TYP96697.1 endonuclease/exonuclease/phosphatase family metal-dependent hydrolase [Sphingobacterium composti Yoo et al. 2007 non Ten et al. 2007]
MDLYIVWQTRRKWGRLAGVLFLVCSCFYLTKSSKSAVFSTTTIRTDWAISDAVEGELSLLTYNVAGLPDLLSAAETPRAQSMREISGKLNKYDIVNVQEDFHYHKELYDGGDIHPYRTLHKEAVPYGDGLNTLSKYPIVETRRVAWKHCHGTDCLAAKGFSYNRIQLAKDLTVDVYNLHATAQDTEGAAQARRKNLLQLADYIAANSAGEAVLVMGDFNAHYAAHWDNMSAFAQKTGLIDAWVMAMNDGKHPPVKQPFTPNEKLALTDSCESIDKIFFRNSLQIEFTPRSYKVEKQHFSTRSGKPLSDHCAISFVLSWKKKME